MQTMVWNKIKVSAAVLVLVLAGLGVGSNLLDGFALDGNAQEPLPYRCLSISHE